MFSAKRALVVWLRLAEPLPPPGRGRQGRPSACLGQGAEPRNVIIQREHARSALWTAPRGHADRLAGRPGHWPARQPNDAGGRPLQPRRRTKFPDVRPSSPPIPRLNALSLLVVFCAESCWKVEFFLMLTPATCLLPRPLPPYRKLPRLPQAPDDAVAGLAADRTSVLEHHRVRARPTPFILTP